VNRWFPKSVCSTDEHRKLESSDFITLFWTVVAVSVFSLLALFAEMFILFALVRFGQRLGPLGRFLKRFLLNVEPGEEDQTLVQYQKADVTSRKDRLVTTTTGLTKFVTWKGKLPQSLK